MTKVKVLQILVVVLLVLNMVSLALHFRSVREGRPGSGIRNQFGFNDDQIAQFEQSRIVIRDKMDGLTVQLHDLSKSYYQTVPENEGILDEIDIVNRHIYKAHYQHFKDIRSICEPEQLDKVDDFIERLLKSPPQKSNRPNSN